MDCETETSVEFILYLYFIHSFIGYEKVIRILAGKDKSVNADDDSVLVFAAEKGKI